MKLIHVAFGLVAASLLPSASADEPALKGKPFTISFASDVSPVSHPDFRYPSYAGVRDLQGLRCDFDIIATGKAEAVDVVGCSAHIFHRSGATNVVKSMTFAPKAQSGVKMKIRWNVERTPRIKTASLN